MPFVLPSLRFLDVFAVLFMLDFKHTPLALSSNRTESADDGFSV
jgi:hypothetical protein